MLQLGLPALVILPLDTDSPLEPSEGTRPGQDMSDRAVAKREKSPASVAMENAVTVGMPRRQESTDATGARSPAASGDLGGHVAKGGRGDRARTSSPTLAR